MSSQLSDPIVHRENALNALIEIRACYDDLQSFLAGTFARLDGLADDVRILQTAVDRTKRHAEQDVMQQQIDQLARLANELAQSVAEQKQLTANDKWAGPKQAEM